MLLPAKADPGKRRCGRKVTRQLKRCRAAVALARPIDPKVGV